MSLVGLLIGIFIEVVSVFWDSKIFEVKDSCFNWGVSLLYLVFSFCNCFIYIIGKVLFFENVKVILYLLVFIIFLKIVIIVRRGILKKD